MTKWFLSSDEGATDKGLVFESHGVKVPYAASKVPKGIESLGELW